MCAKVLDKLFDKWKKIVFLILYVIYRFKNVEIRDIILDKYSLFQMHYAVKILLHLTRSNNFFH